MIKIEENKDLKTLNSFGVAASAAKLISYTTAAELQETLAADPSLVAGKWEVLGGGNNILFTGDYDGTLLHPAGGEISITSENALHVHVRVDAGVVWDDFVVWCVERGLWGVENLSGVPSSTGAAPVQNIGAYGAEVKDVVMSVETLHIATLSFLTIAAEHCAFGYRDSIFKSTMKNKTVITAVNMRLSKMAAPNLAYGALADEVAKLGGPELRNIRQAVMNIRDSKLPDPAVVGNAGSFFKNPIVEVCKAEELIYKCGAMPIYPVSEGYVKLSAGWLIDQAGWKGANRGPAGVYPKQALILVNNSGATGADVIALAEEIRADVKAKFGITIEPEVNIW